MFVECTLTSRDKLFYRRRQKALEEMGMVAAIAYVHPDDIEALHLAADAINARRGLQGGAFRPLARREFPPLAVRVDPSSENPSISELIERAAARKGGAA